MKMKKEKSIDTIGVTETMTKKKLLLVREGNKSKGGNYTNLV